MTVIDGDTMSAIAILAADAFAKAERVRILEMLNLPMDYVERKKAFVELAKARHEADEARSRLDRR